MRPTAVTHAKGLLQDPRTVWTKPTFFQAYPDFALLIAKILGFAVIAVTLYLLKP